MTEPAVSADLIAAIEGSDPAVWQRTTVSAASAIRATNPKEQIEAARERFERFRVPLALLLGKGGWNGEIRSELLDWPGSPDEPLILVKADHALPMTGSIKARGGVHELLVYIERIARDRGLLSDDYSALASDAACAVFADYEISVASTGNLGFSIGLVGRAFGLRATVHMSNDAKAWKKDRLRAAGATVIEHQGDYGAACEAARTSTPDDQYHHFVDDENSADLFWGYAAAAEELRGQLHDRGLIPSPARPLVVYLPCGVGGAPGGITCGLKAIFGQSVICVVVEPTASPCMLLALAACGSPSAPPSVYSLGLDNKTVADGLAVARASPLVLNWVGDAIDAAISVSDATMLSAAAGAWTRAGLRLEPSAAASLAAIPVLVSAQRAWPKVNLPQAIHIAWATGGSMLPSDEWQAQLMAASAAGDLNFAAPTGNARPAVLHPAASRIEHWTCGAR